MRMEHLVHHVFLLASREKGSVTRGDRIFDNDRDIALAFIFNTLQAKSHYDFLLCMPDQ